MPPTFYLIISFLLGLTFGSFLNVVIWRLPRGESIAAGRSRCTSCGHTLAWYDLFPLFSFLFLGGRCRYCQAPISRRYPLVEALTGAVFLLVFWRFGLTWALAKYLFLSCLLVAVAFIDYDTQLIPDSLVITGAVGGIVLGLLSREVGFLSAVVGALVGGGFLLLVAVICQAVFQVEGMGFGDVKLMAVIGLYLGWPLGPLGLLLGIFAGGLLSLILLLFKLKGRKDAIPFGPAIVLGTFLALFWGRELINWYLHLGG